MSLVTTYLTLYNAMEAISFYQDVFDAELVEDIDYLSNFEGYEEYDDKIAHAPLRILDTIIFINDNLEAEPLTVGDHIQLVVQCPDEEFLERAFTLLEEDGYVFSDLQPVPWGSLSGTVRDKFHVTWTLFIE